MANDFSERFRTALSRKCPESAPHLRDCESEESLELRLPAPSGHGDLFVTTAGGEVTVGFGPWHTHFEEFDRWPDGEPRGDSFEQVVTFLNDFLRDLIAIRVWTNGGRYSASGPSHSWHSCSSATCGIRHGDRVKAISWTGRRDTPDVPTDPAAFQEWLRSGE